MLFFLVFAALLLAVLAAVGMPLLSGATVLPERGQYDRAVYRDQLRELERDVARGVMSPAEASSARLEIQRRLLAVDSGKGRAAMNVTRSPYLAAAVSGFILVAGGGLYWLLGAPALPDAPFDQRPATQADMTSPGGNAASPHLDMKAAAEKLEQKLHSDPSNGEGWVMYARTESMLGEWQKASNAYRIAIGLGQKSEDVYAGYGEMLVLGADGIVSPAAHDAFAAALAADAHNDVARYYLALADSQAGEVQKAIKAWLALAADIPDDSPMREAIAQRIADAAHAGGIEAPPLPKGTAPEAPAATQSGGPSSDQMDAAAQMPEADRAKMIDSMIAQLAARLQKDPNDLEGWMRLGRAYAVQGKTDQAVDAYEHAARLKPDDPSIKLQAVAALLAPLQASDPLPERAVTLLHEVAAIAPDAPEVLWYLGVVAVREGHIAEARQNWTKLLAALPEGGEDYKTVQAALAEIAGK